MTHPVKEYYAMPVEGEAVNGGDPRGPGNWAKLVWPGIISGYEISDRGQLISPEGTTLNTGLNGNHLYVTLRTPGKGGKGLRVDKLVLGTFVREAGINEVPIHSNGDNTDCRMTNLHYGPPPPRKKPGRKPKTVKAAPKAEAKPKGTKPRSKADYDTIDVSRTYRHRGTGLSVVVDETGKAKMPKVNLTAAEMRAVVLLSQRIAEMNQILGLDK